VANDFPVPLDTIDPCTVGLIDTHAGFHSYFLGWGSPPKPNSPAGWYSAPGHPGRIYRDAYYTSGIGIQIGTSEDAGLKLCAIAGKPNDTADGRPVIWSNQDAPTLIVESKGRGEYSARLWTGVGYLASNYNVLPRKALWYNQPVDKIGFFFAPYWDYPGLPQKRQDLLGMSQCPLTLLNDLGGTNIALVSFLWEPGKTPETQGYHRPNFVVDVGGDMFDRLYNSPAGLRGQYFMQPVIDNCGDIFNAAVVAVLYAAVKAEIDQGNPAEAAFIQKALLDKGAKAWMDEGQGLPGSKGDIAFSVPRWQSFSAPGPNSPILDYLQINANAIHERVSYGAYAPARTQLRIMGAWIDANGNTKIVNKKTTRSMQIAYLGFS
jgi:hypothetical protein